MFGKNFNVPPPTATFQASHITERDELDKFIDKHQFCHSLDVVIPHAAGIPDGVSSCVFASEYYIARNVPIVNLIGEEFIGAFIKNGKFFCLSEGTRVDVDDCIAVGHPGKLIMSLSKDTYEQLGLEGRPTNVYRKKAQSFDVEIDLVASHFVAGKPNYDRVKSRFSELTSLQFDLIFSWEPPEPSISSRSVLNYFRTWGVKVDVCELSCDTWRKSATVFPVVTWEDGKAALGEQSGNHSVDDLLDCVGLNFLDIKEPSNGNDFVSSYRCPEPNETVKHTAMMRCSGLITPNLVRNVFDQLRNAMAGRLSWILLTVHSHQDVSVPLKSSHCHRLWKRTGFYSVVLFPGSNYWLYAFNDNS